MRYKSDAGSGSGDSLRIWLRALRAPFLVASGFPVLLGAFAAFWMLGRLSAGRLALTLGAVLCVHLGSNLANDLFDHLTGCDRANPRPTPFSGGSRVIQDGLISARAIGTASAVFLALGLLQGLLLNNLVPGNRLLLLGVAGLACGVSYSAAPASLSYRGLGEICVFAAFGPLVVGGSYLAQTGILAWFPVLAGVPAGLCVAAILVVNEVLDFESDRRAGKRTLVVRLGERQGYYLYMALYVSAYLWIAMGLSLGLYPALAFLAFVPLALCLRPLLPGRALKDRSATVNASRLTILSHVAVVGLLAVAYLFPA